MREVWLVFPIVALLVSACGRQPPAETPPAPATPIPAAQTIPAPAPAGTPVIPAAPAPTPTPESSNLAAIHRYKAFVGASVASLEERIYAADVIVRATFVSAVNYTIQFNAVEYLKGTGPTTFSVSAVPAYRSIQWDDHEAVLFLTRPSGDGSGTGSAGSSGTFEFVDSTVTGLAMWDEGNVTYTGKLPLGYMPGSRNPVWLPAESTSGASGASSPPSFITASGSPAPTISLADLRSRIDWVEGGDGIEGYDACVEASLQYNRHVRDYEVYHGEPWPLPQMHKTIRSGAPSGEMVKDFGEFGRIGADPKYDKFWHTGEDADLFSSNIVDDDELASNGYQHTITTARSLPAGTYTILLRSQSFGEIPCNFIPEYDRLETIVTVTAPAGTAYEAMFDPTTVDGAVKAAGVLKPYTATDADAATVSDISWKSGTLKIKLDPVTAHTGHIIDIIDVDGDVALSLALSGATVDVANKTLSWPVSSQPWKAGDKMMLRIRKGPP